MCVWGKKKKKKSAISHACTVAKCARVCCPLWDGKRKAEEKKREEAGRQASRQGWWHSLLVPFYIFDSCIYSWSMVFIWIHLNLLNVFSFTCTRSVTDLHWWRHLTSIPDLFCRYFFFYFLVTVWGVPKGLGTWSIALVFPSSWHYTLVLLNPERKERPFPHWQRLTYGWVGCPARYHWYFTAALTLACAPPRLWELNICSFWLPQGAFLSFSRYTQLRTRVILWRWDPAWPTKRHMKIKNLFWI